MITDLGPVTGDAYDEQVIYLLGSQVSWVGRALQEGQLRLLQGRLTSGTALGEQRTIFSELGGMNAHEQFGLENFLIRHVFDVLHLPDCTDIDSRQSVDAIVELLAAGSFIPNVTLVQGAAVLVGDNYPMVVDGNKSASAYHHVMHLVTISSFRFL
jgi:hypothetical protein